MEQNTENLLSNLKLLYVEDETEAREGLYKYLKRRVGKIYAAADGVEGLALYKEHKPDILLTDLYMPNMDGLELVTNIRKLNSNCHVIIISAVSDVDVIVKSVDTGINKYIMKPVDPNELFAALSEAAEKITKYKSSLNIVDAERKKRLEDDIKREFSAFLKVTAGKGPRDVKVFIHDDTIDITAYDALTIMEKNMIDNRKNNVIIEQNRKLFYSINETVICQMLEEIIGKPLMIKQVEINADKAMNQLIISIL